MCCRVGWGRIEIDWKKQTVTYLRGLKRTETQTWFFIEELTPSYFRLTIFGEQNWLDSRFGDRAPKLNSPRCSNK